MSYRENPKTKGSGIICAIPQEGTCPNGCAECFFQSGRSYLEPLAENLPNLPTMLEASSRVVRVNDGNDSNVDRPRVIAEAARYPMHFFNTAIPGFDFPGPVVLTVNPATMTDLRAFFIDKPPSNLMFVRVRTNTWNLDEVVDPAVKHYTEREVPVVLTFMAYFNEEPPAEQCDDDDYVWRQRTINSYWAITTAAWERVMARYAYNKWVHSCGKIEGEKGSSACRHCGNCLREYFATMERMRLTGDSE